MAVSWVVDEAISPLARRILVAEEILIAPELLLAEAANAVWKNFQAANIDRRQAEAAIEVLPQFFSALFPLQPLAGPALALANDLKRPVYDCFYLALAEAEEARLVTDDKRLLKAVKDSNLADRVIALDKWNDAKSTR